MYKPIIGLEVHCELKTKSKGFSTAPNEYVTTPNVNVSAVDLGLPGILPYTNKEACRKALKTALALNCETPNEIVFDRKNYFYPDLPKGYQITQNNKPMGRNGHLIFFVNDYEKGVAIHQLHLEEDTASLEHRQNYSLINYNRSGIPLMEIVTEPCIYSSDEAVAFLEALRDLFLYLEVSDAKTDRGEMRCDVNISLMKETDTEFGTKVELKNINSFTNVKIAIEYEIERQTKILEAGKKVIQETRRIGDDLKTYSMREKVDAVDYKYFIEPNLPPIKITSNYIDEIKVEIPMLQFERIKKYVTDYDLSKYDATVLAKERSIADYYEEVLSYTNDPKIAANWVSTVVLGSLNKLELTLEEFFITPQMLANVINYVKDGKISVIHGKKIIYEALANKIDPITIIKEKDIKQITAKDELLSYVKEAIDENEDQVKQYMEGKDYVANYFVGKVMNKTNRQANPKVALELIKEELERRKK
ncbi:MAG: Asp-tRNA(Asn)/Glu-tRNA(Gln) amidotransferase subunit GatB [Bacilli bacterium]|nr:Asp-tRNA(Asn)/Glu-tRNA(Gln) amidotransferase subunit GatB [Bacilli bacterium]